MDKKFDWDGFKKGEFVVHVKTQEEYDEFIEACKEHGINTCSAKSNLFNIYKENTCIGATISYCEYDWYAKNDIKIVKFEQEKEPAPSANDTSSEVKTLHLDDSILLDICQEGTLKISDRIAECADGDDYILGYVHAILDVVEQLRGGYRMSHEERRLLAGTHELFKKKEEK